MPQEEDLKNCKRAFKALSPQEAWKLRGRGGLKSASLWLKAFFAMGAKKASVVWQADRY